MIKIYVSNEIMIEIIIKEYSKLSKCKKYTSLKRLYKFNNRNKLIQKLIKIRKLQYIENEILPIYPKIKIETILENFDDYDKGFKLNLNDIYKI